jgi:putative ABC transport system permease protein
MPTDLRLALLLLGRRRRSSGVCIVLLSVGLGAALTLFGAVDATLLQPLPYPQVSQVEIVGTRSLDATATNGLLTRLELTRLGAMTDVVAALGGAAQSQDSLLEFDAPREVQIATVTSGFFDVFALPPARGRTFTGADHVRGSPIEAVMSYSLWRGAFGKSPDVIGKAVRLGNTGYAQVVGVAAPGLNVPLGTDLWLNDRARPTETAREYEAFVRLRPAVRADSVGPRFDAVLGAVAAERSTKPYASTVTPLRRGLIGDTGPALALAGGAALFLLILACTAVATILLVDRTLRKRDSVIQFSLGASAARLIRQALLASAVLGALALVGGTGVALLFRRLFGVLSAAAVPGLEIGELDHRFAAAGLILYFLCCLAVVSPTAVNLRRQDFASALSDRSASKGARGIGSLGSLIWAGVALAVVMVVGCGWLVTSFRRLLDRDPGFATTDRLVVDVTLPHDRKSAGPSLVDRLDRFAGDLRSLPDVSLVAYANTLPLQREHDVLRTIDLLAPSGRIDTGLRVRHRLVSPGFFAAAGIPVVTGREFDGEDRVGKPEVVIVNQSFVGLFVRAGNPLNYSLSYLGFDTKRQPQGAPIVGIVADARYASLGVPAEPTMYSSSLQFGPAMPRQSFIVKAPSDRTGALAAAIFAYFRASEPLAAVSVVTVRHAVASSLSRNRLAASLMASFALIALVVAGGTTYALVAWGAQHRRKEVALRLALGAEPSAIHWLLAKRVALPALLGLASGLGAAFLMGRFAEARTALVDAGFSLEQVVAVVVLVLTLAAATLAPAMRASRVSISATLKE